MLLRLCSTKLNILYLCSEVVSSGFQRDWSGFASGSRLSKSKVVNENEKSEIHESNVAILDSMSEEQMEQERLVVQLNSLITDPV